MNIGRLLINSKKYDNLIQRLRVREVAKVFPSIHVNWENASVSAGAQYVTRDDFVNALIILAAEMDCTPEEFYDKYTDYSNRSQDNVTKITGT